MFCCKWIQKVVSLILLFGLGWLRGPLKCSVSALTKNENLNISHILNSLQIDYDKRVRPNYGGTPVTVGITLYIISIRELSEKFMDFTIDMYFRQFWNDSRLSFERQPSLEKLVVGAEYVNIIWVPDMFFVNQKDALFHQAITENQLLRISHTGEVLLSMHLTIKAGCPMDFGYFPMDSQMCTLDIESFKHTMSDIKQKWQLGEKSVMMDKNIHLPQFIVLGHRQRIREVSLSSGNHSRLLVDVQFTRSMGYYIIQVYIPSSLIVLMSFMSFWLNSGAAAARVGLGITSVLTMTTLMGSVNATFPKTSYIKSVDIYLGTCFFFVFGALIEYVVVGYTEKTMKISKNRFRDFTMFNNMSRHDNFNRQSSTCCVPGSSDAAEEIVEMKNLGAVDHEGIEEAHQEHSQAVPLLHTPSPTCQTAPIRLFRIHPSDIDKYSKVLFPVIFTIFHFLYWMFYLTVSNKTVTGLIWLKKSD